MLTATGCDMCILIMILSYTGTTYIAADQSTIKCDAINAIK